MLLSLTDFKNLIFSACVAFYCVDTTYSVYSSIVKSDPAFYHIANVVILKYFQLF